MYETLLIDRKEGTGIITLNRPEKLNALSTALFRELDLALTELEQDKQVGVVLVTGAGEKAFSAGADIHEMVDSTTGADRVARAARTGDWLGHLIAYQKPTIGVINGLAYGGGALLSSSFDIRIGCERTIFRFLGVTYGRINSTWSLPLIVGLPLAKELLFTGRIIMAEEAFRIGLLNRLVTSADLMQTALEIGQSIAKNDAGTVRLIRKIVNENAGLGARQALANEARNIAESLRPPPPRESFKEFLSRKGKKDSGAGGST